MTWENHSIILPFVHLDIAINISDSHVANLVKQVQTYVLVSFLPSADPWSSGQARSLAGASSQNSASDSDPSVAVEKGRREVERKKPVATWTTLRKEDT